MADIKTWADLGALTEDERAAYTPEDLEALKTSLVENEARLVEERKVKDDELAKAKEIAENQRIRAEKAEKEAKEKGVKADEQLFTAKDTLALVEAKVSSEDYDEVVRVAKILGKPVVEALKDKTMLAILSERVEERRTAEATLTGKTQRGVSKTTGEDLLQRAETTGEVPEDEDGMKKLFQARMARKLKK